MQHGPKTGGGWFVIHDNIDLICFSQLPRGSFENHQEVLTDQRGSRFISVSSSSFGEKNNCEEV